MKTSYRTRSIYFSSLNFYHFVKTCIFNFNVDIIATSNSHNCTCGIYFWPTRMLKKKLVAKIFQVCCFRKSLFLLCRTMKTNLFTAFNARRLLIYFLLLKNYVSFCVCCASGGSKCSLRPLRFAD